ncbi:molybdenum cofactor biosynthesis protein MoaE [Lentzea sp. NPDC051208]|uniref:molybdenum cofactor biosynthesis protein n=1 Tax=Lentzea sp. NPDC051208 TaxID=3154642 RepID=UPI00344543EF
MDDIEIQVLYFGALREKFTGTRQETVGATNGTTVGDFMDQLCGKYAGLDAVRHIVKIAVNEEMASPSQRLSDGDVVAMIPPVAGGSDPYCRLTEQPLDLNEALAAVAGPGQGGVVVFLGLVRDTNDGRSVTELEYEAYPSMVIRTFLEIIKRCEAIADGVRVGIAHRTGSLQIGEAAVIIAASAPHRAEAFEAARTCIDLLKQETPIWKKEFSPDGHEWIGMRP